MAKTVGTGDLIEVWGSDRVAQGAPALVAPNQTTIEKGFVNGIASANDFTWVPNVLGAKVNHVLQNGVPQWVSTTAYVAGNVVGRSNNIWLCLIGNTNSAPTQDNVNWDKINKLPNGYINTPVPFYATTRTVTVNGSASARSGDNLADLTATGNNTVSLDNANVLNGRANGVSLTANTFYYLYLIQPASGGTGGYLWDTTQGLSTHTVATVVYKSRQLPLAVRVDASSNIIPFRLDLWAGRNSIIRYHKAWKRAKQGTGEPVWNTAVQTGQIDLRVATSLDISQTVITTWSTISVANYVPAGATKIDIWPYRVSAGGNAWEAYRGVTSQTGIEYQQLTSATAGYGNDIIIPLSIDSSLQFQVSAISGVAYLYDYTVIAYNFSVN
jgi:hypothetical protein